LIREPFLDFDAELHAIYLLKSIQRSGVGRRLARAWAAAGVSRGLRAAVVRVLAANPACMFYERLGAELLRDTHFMVGGKSYPERWYGWRNLPDLTYNSAMQPDHGREPND
jgi:ribosomal protein S18 acetylase RimI-like enzyme